MIELENATALRDPIMIAAFEGWNDAGEAATACVEHLEATWSARPLGSVDPDPYYDFQVNRPVIAFGTDGTRRIDWPTTRLTVATMPDSLRDVVLVRGIEPNLRWRSFCAEILDAAATLGVERVITLGALLADVPHTRPVPVTIASGDRADADELGLEPSSYEGPTGIVGVFQNAAHHAALSSMSLWAAVPHYVAQTPCPKATLVLLQKLEDILDTAIPLGDIADEAEAWQHGVDELADDDAEIADYVHRLEDARVTVDLPEASGDHIAREFERYLRRRDY